MADLRALLPFCDLAWIEYRAVGASGPIALLPGMPETRYGK